MPNKDLIRESDPAKELFGKSVKAFSGEKASTIVGMHQNAWETTGEGEMVSECIVRLGLGQRIVAPIPPTHIGTISPIEMCPTNPEL